MASASVVGSEASTGQAKPPWKFVGGKSKLIPELLKYLPEVFGGDYYEPFFGGGALFWHLANKNRFKRAAIGDSNSEIVNALEVIRDNPGELIATLRKAAGQHSASFYDSVRSKLLMRTDSLGMAARFMYLNKTCFNGLYRVNKTGQFNVPMGKYKNPNICDEFSIRECSIALQETRGRRIVIRSQDFEKWNMKPGDVCYMDPPYWPVSKTASFTSYGSDGFGPEDQIRLARRFRELADMGVHVVLSNADVPAVRDLYHGFKMHSVQAARAVNSDGDKRGPVGELIIVSNQ